MNDAYDDILRRIEKADQSKPSALRRPVTELLINHPAVRPHDECPAASDKVARYKLPNGASLAHEYQAAQNWWVAEAQLPSSFRKTAEFYPEGRSRNSNLACMPDLATAPAYKVTLKSIEEAEELLNELLAA